MTRRSAIVLLVYTSLAGNGRLTASMAYFNRAENRSLGEDMGRFFLAIIGCALANTFFSVPVHAVDYRPFAMMWAACKNPYNGDYRRIKIGQGSKAMVGGYHPRTKKGHCFWMWKKYEGYITQLNLMTICHKKGYKCAPLAVNNKMTDYGKIMMNDYKIYNRQLAQARMRREQQQARKQRRWTQDDQEVLNSVLGILGGMATGGSGSAFPSISAPSSGSVGGGEVCTPSQKARGWSDDRCAVN